MNEFEMSLHGWRITTAEICYRLPDTPRLLQLYVWQEFDRLPHFPRLNTFLRFWESNLDGPLHSVRVAVRGIIDPTDLKHIGDEYTLN